MRKISIIVLITLLVFTNTAVAHQGILINKSIDSIDKSYEITNIEKSQAIYSRLEDSKNIDFYKFEGKAGQKFYSQLMVPDTERDRNFLLHQLVIGPFEENIPEEYLHLLDGHSNGYEVRPGNNRTKFFEPFTQTSYIKLQQFLVELPQDGTYYIAVFNRFEQEGKYVLTVGQEEQFGLSDLLSYPRTWFMVNYWFNPFRPFSILILLGLVLFTVVKLIRKRKRAKRF